MLYVSTTHAHVKKLYKSALVLQTVNRCSPIFHQLKQLGPQRLWGLSYFVTVQPALTYFVSRSSELSFAWTQVATFAWSQVATMLAWGFGGDRFNLREFAQTYNHSDLRLKCCESCVPAVPRSCVLQNPYHSCAVGGFEMPSASFSFHGFFLWQSMNIIVQA